MSWDFLASAVIVGDVYLDVNESPTCDECNDRQRLLLSHEALASYSAKGYDGFVSLTQLAAAFMASCPLLGRPSAGDVLIHISQRPG